MRAPATPASNMARPRSTTTSALSPIGCAQSAPTAVAKRKPDRRRTKYEGKSTPKTRKRSGCTRLPSCGGRDLRRCRRRRGLADGALPLDGWLARLGRRNARRAHDGMSALAREHVDRHQPHPDTDGDVGDIERGPVALGALEENMGVDEVDDLPIANAVEDVPQRPAEDERKAPLQRALAWKEPPVERHDTCDRRDRYEQEERTAHVLARRLQEPPRPSPVASENEREMVLPNFDDPRIPLQMLRGPSLRRDVGGERHDRDDCEKDVRRAGPAIVADDPGCADRRDEAFARNDFFGGRHVRRRPVEEDLACLREGAR